MPAGRACMQRVIGEGLVGVSRRVLRTVTLDFSGRVHRPSGAPHGAVVAMLLDWAEEAFDEYCGRYSAW